jgi:hypothetical protein
MARALNPRSSDCRSRLKLCASFKGYEEYHELRLCYVQLRCARQRVAKFFGLTRTCQ